MTMTSAPPNTPTPNDTSKSGRDALASLRIERTAPRVAVSTEADRPRREADRSVDPSLPLDERIKAQWERDADLRAEFGGNFELYQSYAAAEEAGQVKRYSPHGRG